MFNIVYTSAVAGLLLAGPVFSLNAQVTKEKTGTAVKIDYELPKAEPQAMRQFIEKLLRLEHADLLNYEEYLKKAPPALIAAGRRLQDLKDATASDKSLARFAVLKGQAMNLEALAKKARRQLVDEARQYFEHAEQLVRRDAMLAMQIAMNLDKAKERELASAAMTTFAKPFSKFNSLITPYGKVGEFFANFGNRDRLIGRTFTFSGTRLDGEAFDFKQLKGKVVLVQFTWLNLSDGKNYNAYQHASKLYDKYKRRGLEVLTVSLDLNERALRETVAKRKIPWPIVYDRRGKSANKLGVTDLPHQFVVDRKGIVLSAAADAKLVERLLLEQFGGNER